MAINIPIVLGKKASKNGNDQGQAHLCLFGFFNP